MKRQVRKCARSVLAPLIHVLTAAGLSEKELATVCRQIIRGLPASPTTKRLTGLSEHRYLEHVIAKWNNDPHYLLEGQPILLKLKGKRPSLGSLVRGVSASASAANTLRLLSERGLVSVDRAGRAKLLVRFYPVRARGALDLELFTTMTVDFLRTHE